jgi:PhoH-like ATPase
MLDTTAASPTETGSVIAEPHRNGKNGNGQLKNDSRSGTPKRVKSFVLDTNVLLHDPKSPFHFDDNNVLIPIEVVEEIDQFKRDSSELGRNARSLSRLLDEARGQGSLSEGVQMENGGYLRILMGEVAIQDSKSVDSRILRQALQVRENDPDTAVILVTKDINLRIRADAHGIEAEDYETDQVHLSELYSGIFTKQVGPEEMSRFRSEQGLDLEANHRHDPGEYCTLMNETDPKRTQLAKVDADGQRLVPILDSRDGIWGIRPRNREQRFALDALMDDRVRLVTLMGKAGTGKTLLAMAAGLKRTVVDREFRRMIVARPTISMGKELGFLPGSLDEKLSPWMQPIHDALEMLGDLNMGQENRRSSDLLRSGMIVVEALSYIRGRSIANQFMIIDEAQNLTPLEVKTIVTRVGSGTKIVLTGDPFQIDNPYVDSSSNGFNYLISRFREHSIAAHVELEQGERSALAELAADVL